MSNVTCKPDSVLLPAHQRGVGLLEILIAVVIMSVGFLAAARMQVEGMRFSQSAYFQSQAYFMASDMIDRMRSNIPGVEQGFYDGKTTSADADDPGCNTNRCNPRGLSLQDIHDWSSSLHSLQGASSFIPALPGTDTTPASGTIQKMDDGVYAVVMNWSEVIQGENNQQELRIQFALEESHD
ncbi:type IV pilus modification protein PilV [Granulosicoccus antarcticus]|uniref:type IV pilus modification protein PilV n=1 Tax=Granulosicoccus antarcticus TaxID=437505 RepID=UPI0012FD3DF8|nr:type IV pilus modification protein PilV [Granulosicoccus antarcticus]